MFSQGYYSQVYIYIPCKSQHNTLTKTNNKNKYMLQTGTSKFHAL